MLLRGTSQLEGINMKGLSMVREPPSGCGNRNRLKARTTQSPTSGVNALSTALAVVTSPLPAIVNLITSLPCKLGSLLKALS